MERRWPYILLFNRALCSLLSNYYQVKDMGILTEDLQYVLVEIGRFKGKCQLYKLTQSIYMSQMNVSMSLAELARKGMITITDSDEGKIITYTDYGNEYFDQFTKRLIQLEDEITRVLGKEDKEKLEKYSQKFHIAMSKGDFEMEKIPEHWHVMTHFTTMIEKKLEYVLRRVAELNTFTNHQRMILLDILFFEKRSREMVARVINVSTNELDKECEYLYKRGFVIRNGEELSLSNDGITKASGILSYLFHIEQMGKSGLTTEEQNEYTTLLSRAVDAASRFTTMEHRFDYEAVTFE